MIALIEKMLLEPDFMIEIIVNGSSKTIEMYEATVEQKNLFDLTKDDVRKFFGITRDNEGSFQSRIEEDTLLREHFIEYANAKYTYCLVNQRVGYVAVGVVWCSGYV